MNGHSTSRSGGPRRGVRVLLVLPLAALVVTSVPTAASAHSEFSGSDPADGARLSSVPDRLTLTFEDGVDPRLARVALRVGDGSARTLPAQVAGNQVTVPVPPDTRSAGAAAPWQVAYRIISADGHPVSGEIGFTVAAAPTSAPTSAAPSTAPTSAAPSPAAALPPAGSAQPSPSPVSDTQAATDEGTGGTVSWIAGVTALLALAGGVALAVRRRQAAAR